MMNREAEKGKQIQLAACVIAAAVNLRISNGATKPWLEE
jgi:hypothetical protein